MLNLCSIGSRKNGEKLLYYDIMNGPFIRSKSKTNRLRVACFEPDYSKRNKSIVPLGCSHWESVLRLAAAIYHISNNGAS